MAITAEQTITLAEVEVADDYRVELKQHEQTVAYTWEQAEQLAHELFDAVERAREVLREDHGTPAAPHGFDVDGVRA